jgi:predicted phosphoribosyltransferase
LYISHATGASNIVCLAIPESAVLHEISAAASNIVCLAMPESFRASCNLYISHATALNNVVFQGWNP